jgi:hypothetical protein
MLDNRLVRLAGVLALGAGLAVAGTGLVAGVAGATGSTPAPFTIKVDGANSSTSTTSATSTLTVSGLPSDATGTVVFDQAGSPLCTATLPSHTCTSVTLAPGSYPGITGTYSGDGTYAGSTSTNSVSLTVLASGGPTTTCSKVSGYVTRKITFSYCQVSQKGAHIAGADLLTGGSLTWNASKAVTTYTGSATSPGQGACTAGHTEEDFTGTVTADGSTFTTVGGTVTYDVCESSTGVVKLVPGTKATF